MSHTQGEQNDSSFPNEGKAEKVSKLMWLVNQEDPFSMLPIANITTV
jgi:hypothetical protein